MEISQTTQTVQSTPTFSDKDAISSDFETFIKMLTAQMENQDPLNPLDSQDFATQLATFSGVEQQVKTNELLDSLGSQMALSGLGEMAGWVGMQGRIAASVDFTGNPIELALDPATTADSVELVVSNASGQEVNRIPVNKLDETFLWTGENASGGTVSDGVYNFELISRKDGAVIDQHVPEAYVPIDEVRLQNGASVIVLQGGTVHPASAVMGLRAPS